MGGAPTRNAVFLILITVLSAFSGACTFAPTAELRVFRESVVAANTAATPLIDELSGAERRAVRNERFLDDADKIDGRKFIVFNPAEARYFSELGDGPAAAKFRRAHNVLDRLSDVLVSLATGAGAEADVGAIESLASEVGGLVDVIQPGASTAVAAAEKILHGALIQVSKEFQRRDARRIIFEVQEQKLVRHLTDNLRQSTIKMFEVLVGESWGRAAIPGASKETKDAYADRAVKVRLVLSNYVVLLERVNDAWIEAAKAAESRSSGNLASLTERISELKAAAVSTRKAYAEATASRR